jgi:hypothetical protein
MVETHLMPLQTSFLAAGTACMQDAALPDFRNFHKGRHTLFDYTTAHFCWGWANVGQYTFIICQPCFLPRNACRKGDAIRLWEMSEKMLVELTTTSTTSPPPPPNEVAEQPTSEEEVWL